LQRRLASLDDDVAVRVNLSLAIVMLTVAVILVLRILERRDAGAQRRAVDAAIAMQSLDLQTVVAGRQVRNRDRRIAGSPVAAVEKVVQAELVGAVQAHAHRHRPHGKHLPLFGAVDDQVG